MITSLDQLDLTQRYTYDDYLLWQFRERVELIKGWILPMVSPSMTHQEISSNLHGYLWTHFRKHPCRLFAAPFDVRLPLPAHRVIGDKIDTVVQPDLCVVCDEAKLDERGCMGAPDLVVEILSPSNSKREMKNKFELYQEAGVLEYWIVDPTHRTVLCYKLAGDHFVASAPPLTDEDILRSSVFEEMEIPLEAVFPEEKIEANVHE